MSAAVDEEARDLQWAMESGRQLDLHSLSFFLSKQTSACFQPTQHSMNVNIAKCSSSQFSSLLNAFSLPGFSPSLKNLEFHSVEWELQQLEDLKVLLESNPSVEHLIFKSNMFDTECLSQLSEVLRRNKYIKHITLSESGIGSQGAVKFASALKDNRTLEELQIWEDSIGLRGAEELSKMIEVNSTLKLLTIFDSKSITATPLISSVLARNRSMEVHIWSADHTGKNSSKVVEFIPENSTLRIYHIDLSGACRVVCSLGRNSTVRLLDMTGVRLKSRWAKEFRWVLEQNQILKEVILSKTSLKDKGAVYVAAGLFKNRSLEKLDLDGNSFSGVGVEHLLCPLSRFSSLQNQANTTLKSMTLGGGRTKIGRNGLAAILNMLTTNQSVTHLGIHNDQSMKPDNVVKIFKSLERNSTLRRLSLQGCKGVKGEQVFQAITEMLNVNPWIEEIDLVRTPLHVAGKTEGVYQRMGQTETDIDSLKDMAMTMPRNCRVFLCGQEHSGKSTLCNSISHNISPSKLPYIDQVRVLVIPVEQASINIRTLKDEDTKISIWNLAGQHEFYSPHDLMFPGHGSASLFLIVSCLFRKPSNNREQKTPSEIEEDIQYWLRFVVSNSRRAAQQCMLPSVTIVLTHHDKINQQSDDFQAAVSLIQRLREKFVGFVDLYPTVFTVDARSLESVCRLSHHIRRTSKTILERVPRVYQLCNDIVDVLSVWRKENQNRPAMKWREFGELCQVKVPSLRVRSRHNDTKKMEMKRRAVATNLHHIGEVIYFEELELLILDCEWFCGEVLSKFTRLDMRKQGLTEKDGFVRRKEFEKILKGNQVPGMEIIEDGDLIKMMLKLELCCEQDPSDPDSPLLVVSNLEDGRWRPQRWQATSPAYNHVGRRLQCDDMFLTPAGFFPRLQVHLYNKIMGLRDQHGASYSLEKHLISINIHGIYVRVELGGQLGIDALACSSKSPTEMLRLFQHLIIPAIQSVCHGITLTEHVLRSECVKNLTPPRHRRKQCVSLQQLKQALLSVPADAIYDYQHTWDSVTDILGPGFDFARDLLSDDDFREVLHTRYHDLYNLAMELQVPEEDDSETSHEITSTVEPTFVGIAKGVEAVLQRLKIIEQEIKDVKQEIQGLRYYEHSLLIELHQKVNYLVNYNIQVEERKVPNMLYLVRTENYSRRLVTTMISGMSALRLHMLCEFRREMHVVGDQIGCEIMQVDNITVRCLAPYMKRFMTLVTFALKIGAHLAVGMGEMIPDLGKEVAHLIDSPMLYGAAAVGAAGVAAGSRNTRDIGQDLRTAQQWLLDFLREHRCSTGKDIADKFGLWRVRYKDDGQIAWICRWHMHTRAYEITQVPI